jgi:RNA polymerase sigma factor (sigma-70 family)
VDNSIGNESRRPSQLSEEERSLISAESDTGLLALMAKRESDELWAEQAYREFHARHCDYVYGICRKVAKELRGEAWVEDTFSDTFTKAYLRADTFKLEPGVTGEAERLRVRGWLGKIAENHLRQILSKRLPEHTADESFWATIEGKIAEKSSHAQPSNSDYHQRLQRIIAALSTLTDREQHVIRVTFQYYRLGEKFQRLPNDVASDLAAALGTTPENLRKIRERALKKLKDHVQNNQNETDKMASNE